MYRRALAAMMAMMLTAGAWALEVDARHTIRPGDGIGVIRLGMGVKDVHEAMAAWGAKPMMIGASGGPAAWLDEQSGAAIEAYQTDSLGRGHYGNIMKVFYVKNRVAQIAVQSVAYATTKGAMSRLTSDSFRALHPSLRARPVQESWGGKLRAYDSESMGLAVTYNVLAGDREASSAQEILVHVPGSPVILESARHPGNIAKTGTDAKKPGDQP